MKWQKMPLVLWMLFYQDARVGDLLACAPACGAGSCAGAGWGGLWFTCYHRFAWVADKTMVL